MESLNRIKETEGQAEEQKAFLAPLFSPKITESYLQINHFKDLASAREEKEGINPFKLYCSRTGRELGYLTDSLIHSNLLTLLGKEQSNNSEEEILDELTSRCLLSMRPGMDLIYLSGKTMKALITHDPKTAVIFYMTKAFDRINRDFRPINSQHEFRKDLDSIDQKKLWNRGLIELQRQFSKEIPIEKVKEFCFLLLAVDARVGLHRLTPPKELWGFDLLTSAKAFNDCLSLIYFYRKALDRIEKDGTNKTLNANGLSWSTWREVAKESPREQSKKQIAKKAKQKKIIDLAAEITEIQNMLEVEENESIAEQKEEKQFPKAKRKIQPRIKRGLKLAKRSGE